MDEIELYTFRTALDQIIKKIKKISAITTTNTGQFCKLYNSPVFVNVLLNVFCTLYLIVDILTLDAG